MYPHTINIDWLQIYLHDENQGIENLAMIYNGKSSYELKRPNTHQDNFHKYMIYTIRMAITMQCYNESHFKHNQL